MYHSRALIATIKTLTVHSGQVKGQMGGNWKTGAAHHDRPPLLHFLSWVILLVLQCLLRQ